MTKGPDRTLSGRILRTRLAILWERLWNAAFPALMVLGVSALTVLTGALAALPPWTRLAALGIAAVAFLASLVPVARVRFPAVEEAVHRIEAESGARHRPATAVRDRIADPAAGPMEAMLWREHQSRMEKALAGLKAVWPRSDLPRRDPIAFRNALGVALVAALALNAGQLKTRIAETVTTVGITPSATTSVDAWIVPPAYTQKPPLLLTSPAAQKRQAEGEEFLAPQASTLVVRLTNAAEPRLAFHSLLPDGEAGPEVAAPEIVSAANAQAAGQSSTREVKVTLDRPVFVRLTDGSSTLAEWRVSLVPDAPPKVALSPEIEVTPTGAFAANWTASDDYGVASIRALFKLSEKDQPAKGRLLYDAPGFPVSLPRLNPKEAKGRAFQDLTAHPWAGLEVEMRLEAKDQAGQMGVSEPVTFKLPERPFRKLLARALVEQRRNIVQAPTEPHKVVRALSALVAYPDGLVESSGVYLSIRDAAARLYEAKSDEDLKSVVAALWDIAISIEDGSKSNAMKDLEAARKELQQALAEGASPEKIAELMDKLREALDRYLEAMARQMMEAMKRGDLKPQKPMPGQELRSQDLKRMLDAIENLARSGARDAAQEMLSQLENLLQNLQPSIGQQGDPQNAPPMAKMLQELGELMRRQQQLMDETYRMPGEMPGDMQGQGEPGQQGQEGQQGQQGQGGMGQQGRGEGLAGQQDGLGRMLQDLMRSLNEQGLGSPNSLGRAQRSMEGAADSLRQSQRDPALGRQGEAMEALREGAQAMAREMMQQQGAGNEGNYGRHGEAGGDDRDPLGRPMPQRGEDYGPERNMLPGQAAIERAREILESLRARANERSRPTLELDYIDRLLRGLY